MVSRAPPPSSWFGHREAHAFLLCSHFVPLSSSMPNSPFSHPTLVVMPVGADRAFLHPCCHRFSHGSTSNCIMQPQHCNPLGVVLCNLYMGTHNFHLHGGVAQLGCLLCLVFQPLFCQNVQCMSHNVCCNAGLGIHQLSMRDVETSELSSSDSVCAPFWWMKLVSCAIEPHKLYAKTQWWPGTIGAS